MPHVRAAGKPLTAPIDIARVEYYLSEWAFWMGGTGGGGGPRGAGGSAGFVNTRTSSTFEEMTADMDRRICKVVDTIIEKDLPLHERVAIHVEYGMAGASVWKFARLDMVVVLAEAKQHLGEVMVRKGVPV